MLYFCYGDDMKNNKGFTLMELLLTIALLAVISVISFVSIIAIINKHKNNQCKTIIDNIKIATKEYVSDNRYGTINANITAKTLIDGHYLSGDIINPYTDETIDPQNVKIKITLNTSDKTVKQITVKDASNNLLFNGCN